MKIAIYTRQSKYNEKSESIESQIAYCKRIAETRFPDITEYAIYTDEGFSGKTAQRPQYKQMLAEIENGGFKALVCYKIDRISRSLSDFTQLQEMLANYNVFILSASEGFDTSTPWGQAVLNILMIFAQLERNNVAERIRDTMMHYGRQGRWTGGLTPTGFQSHAVSYTDQFGQTKKMTILKPIPQQLAIVETIFQKYTLFKSLNQVAKYLNEHHILTKNNNIFTSSTVKDILTNPVYAYADQDTFQFFKEMGSEICNPSNAFDGTQSLMPYNREDKKKHTSKPVKDWIIAVGSHKGIIPGKQWVKTQKLLEKNSVKKPRLGTAERALFSGLVICAQCGSIMRVKNGRTKQDGTKEFYYICTRKENSKCLDCNMPNMCGHKMEQKILEALEAQFKMCNTAHTPVYTPYEGYKEENTRNGALQRIEHNAKNLVKQLALASDNDVQQYIQEELQNLAKEKRKLQSQFQIEKNVAESKWLDPPQYNQLIKAFTDPLNLDLIHDIKTKQLLIKSIISKIVWNGRTATVSLQNKDPGDL